MLINAWVKFSSYKIYAIHMGINLQAKTNRLGRSDAKPALPIWFAIITARVASPQIERLSSVYGTPSDLVRVLVGVGVCAWLIINLFILPKDSGAYRTWMYLGLGVIPLSMLCAVVVW